MDKWALLEKLREEGYSALVIDAFENVRRSDFVPKEYRLSSYEDIALPTFEGQTISPPSCIAMMLDLLELNRLKMKGSVRILEIGSGTGYLLALLSHILPEANILGIEIKRLLAESSSKRLKEKKNISIINKSGYEGHIEESPYDRILISASAPDEKVVERLASQLKDDGIILSPVGFDLVKIKRSKNIIKKNILRNAVMFVPLVK